MTLTSECDSESTSLSIMPGCWKENKGEKEINEGKNKKKKIRENERKKKTKYAKGKEWGMEANR